MSPRLALVFALGALGACATPSHTPAPLAPLNNPLTHAASVESSTRLRSVALGSCNKQHLPQPLWRKIQEEKPELFVWMGDVIYADTHDMAHLARLYQSQLQQTEYAAFLSTGTPLIGVYDDHEFGTNNSGAEFSAKKPSQQLFLDFMGVPQDSPRRQQEGVYQSYRFGTDGQRVKFLVLDTRYHREKPGATADILGSQQWNWLSEELQKKDAELLVLISSIQVLPEEHKFEKWANFPKSRQRLLELLDKAPVPNILIASGDRHFAEISKLTLPSGRELHELTTSGLTHSFREADTDKRNTNSLRIGAPLTRINYGWIQMDWESSPPSVSLEARDINKKPILKLQIPLKT